MERSVHGGVEGGVGVEGGDGGEGGDGVEGGSIGTAGGEAGSIGGAGGEAGGGLFRMRQTRRYRLFDGSRVSA